MNAEGIKNLKQASLAGSVPIFQRALRAALLSLVLLVFGFAIAAKLGLRRLLEVIALPRCAYGIPVGLPFLAVVAQVVLEWRAERSRAAQRALAVKAGAKQTAYFRIGPYLAAALPSVALEAKEYTTRRRKDMRKLLSALAFAGAGCFLTGEAMAEPVKLAIIESLSGGQAAVGKMFLTAVNYGLIKLNNEKAWPDGFKLLEYDNQGGASEASDKVKAAINDGADIIIQGASSAIGGQITGDVLKHNLRNPGKEVIYLNVGAEAMEFTGPKCHFYHFRWNGNAEIRLRAMLVAMNDANALGKRVYVIGQNYSWGRDVQRLVHEYASFGGYTVVGDIIHDVNKIQDFAPYVAKIKEAAPDTVITGNWSSDLLLLMKAAGDAGLKVRFASYWLDQPGNIANAGATALGHYNVSSFNAEANGEATAAFAEDFKAKTGQYPVFVQGHTVHGIWGLGEALKTLKPGPDGRLSVKQLAFAMEKVRFDTSMGEIAMRAEDHQALLPLAVSVVSKDAKYKVDGTDMGFKPVRLISGKEAAGPVQPSCNMERPPAS